LRLQQGEKIGCKMAKNYSATQAAKRQRRELGSTRARQRQLAAISERFAGENYRNGTSNISRHSRMHPSLCAVLKGRLFSLFYPFADCIKHTEDEGEQVIDWNGGSRVTISSRIVEL
jgi:hypothetical protein